MAEPKTKLTDSSVAEFIEKVPDEKKRQDCKELIEIMQQASQAEARMWGDSIVGFGVYTTKYASGREGDWPMIAFSPRKQNLTLYLSSSGYDEYGSLLEKLGKHSTSKACLYIKRLEDVDMSVLKEIVALSVQHTRSINPET